MANHLLRWGMNVVTGCVRGRFFRETVATWSVQHRIGRGLCARSVASPVAGVPEPGATDCRRVNGSPDVRSIELTLHGARL